MNTYLKKTKELLSLLIFLPLGVFAHGIQPAIQHTIPIEELKDYPFYPPIVKEIIITAQALIRQNLTYMYNSSDPKNGGMDCSGTIYYLLKKFMASEIPRDSYGMYQWTLKKGKFYPINSVQFTSSEFSQLKPGDLLFWSGTYSVNRKPPISHVMIYLGVNKDNQPLMFGASDGRTYQNKKMWGVSVFDFKLPKKDSHSRFVGYSCIPDLTCSKGK